MATRSLDPKAWGPDSTGPSAGGTTRRARGSGASAAACPRSSSRLSASGSAATAAAKARPGSGDRSPKRAIAARSPADSAFHAPSASSRPGSFASAIRASSGRRASSAPASGRGARKASPTRTGPRHRMGRVSQAPARGGPCGSSDKGAHRPMKGKLEFLALGDRRSMPSLRIEVKGQVFAARLPETAIRVGRDPACEIRIDDADVSAVHATLEAAPGGGHKLLDGNSGRPTKVNGLAAKRVLLKHGDVVEIGPARIVYQVEGAPAAPARPAPAPAVL